jgi:hypothetical protein
VKRLRSTAKAGSLLPPYPEVINAAADRIEQLERHVELRDWFLVESGLWEKFAKGAQGKTNDR